MSSTPRHRPLPVPGRPVTADVNGASRIESLGDLGIGASDVTVRSATGSDSHIDVVSDLVLGRFTASTVSSGTLRVGALGQQATKRRHAARSTGPATNPASRRCSR